MRAGARSRGSAKASVTAGTVENWNGSTLPAGWTAYNVTPVLDGSGHLTWAFTTNGGGQSQFDSSLPKLLRSVTYNSDGTLLAQHSLAPLPTADIRSIGLYMDKGAATSGSTDRWLWAFSEHYSGTNANIYHKIVFWNGTAIVTGGPAPEGTNTVFDAGGLYQRLRRVGTVMFLDVSTDGVSWGVACSLDMGANAPAGGFTRAGVGAGHDGSTASWTATVDWTSYA